MNALRRLSARGGRAIQAIEQSTIGRSRVARGVALPLGAVAVLAVILVLSRLLGLDAPIYVVALGALIGVSYGLLGVCTALVFRVSGVVNLALPAIGVLAMSVMPILTQVLHLNWWGAFVAVIPIGFAAAALAEAVVIRRLANAPRVVGVIASLGVAGVLASAAGFVKTLNSEVMTPLEAPPGLPSFAIGPLVITPGYTGLIIAAPILTAALTIFLTRSNMGLAIRASASNPDNARLSAISPSLVSAGAWGIAGVISTITTIFFLGTVPANPSASVLSTDVLLPALGAAAIAGFTNLPRALVGGILIGVVQQIMQWNPSVAQYDDLAILVVLFVALLFGRRARGRGERLGSWTAVSGWRPLPHSLARLWPVRLFGPLLVVCAAGAVVFAGTRSTVDAQLWTTTILVAVIALTVVLITGLGGELSLGQFGFALLGGGTSFVVVRESGNFMLGLLAAVVVTGLFAVLLSYPSLRLRGASLTILTLAFAVAVPTAFLADSAVFGRSVVTPQQPVLGSFAINAGVPYFAFAGLVTALCFYVAWNVWRGGYGRAVRAARDNELVAESFGIRVLGTRVVLMLVTGMIAGLAGATLVHSYTTISTASFPLDTNIRLVLAVVMGGIGILLGGPIGVLWLFTSGVAQALSAGGTSEAQQTASLAIYGSALILILIAPGGAAQLLRPLRDILAVGLGRVCGVRYTLAEVRGEKRLDTAPDKARTPKSRRESRASTPTGALELTGPVPVPTDTASWTRPPELRPVPWTPGVSGPLLECRDLELSYGAVTAVGGLSLQLHRGEILGLIGPNGAGKTSTFELIGGFARATSGRVMLDGEDITALSPHARTRRGLVRSFQDAQLFPTMNTLDVIQLSLERQQPTNTVASILGVDVTARRRRQVAEEIIDFFGLSQYRESRIAELSTGTRRFVELAALISMRPRVLLLDEPSSGIAQRESEALGPLLKRLRREFDLSMVIIEHDVPLIMSLSDRVLVMDQGRELCAGTPTEVRADPRVVDAYMGGALEAVHRSDQRPDDGYPDTTTPTHSEGVPTS